MKKRMESVVLGIIMTALVAIPTFAAPVKNSEEVKFVEEKVWVKEEQAVVQLFDRRGNWIADAILEISNPRNGKIGIYAETQCHMGVDEIIVNIAVDKMVGTNKWQQVDYLTYTFDAKAGQDLTDAVVDLQLSGHEANTVYRLRSVHAAILNGTSETLSGTTPGLLITNN